MVEGGEMRRIQSLFAVALLALSVSGCMQNEPDAGATAADRDQSFACPSGECNGVNGAGNMGGNHPF